MNKIDIVQLNIKIYTFISYKNKITKCLTNFKKYFISYISLSKIKT